MSERRRAARFVTVVALVISSGCAQHGVLELQILLPPAPADGASWFAQVQVRNAAGNGFDRIWSGTGDPSPLELGTEPRWDCISARGDDESVDVNVRVYFCRTRDCPGAAVVPERRFHLEHPFYIGRRTYWATSIEAVPRCADDAACDTLGICVDGRCGCRTADDCCPPGGCSCVDPPCYACEDGGCVARTPACRIEGCRVGPAGDGFCDADGRHVCESSAEERPEAYVCVP